MVTPAEGTTQTPLATASSGRWATSIPRTTMVTVSRTAGASPRGATMSSCPTPAEWPSTTTLKATRALSTRSTTRDRPSTIQEVTPGLGRIKGTRVTDVPIRESTEGSNSKPSDSLFFFLLSIYSMTSYLWFMIVVLPKVLTIHIFCL